MSLQADEASAYSLSLSPVAVQWQVAQEIAEIADREDEGAGNASEDLHEQAHFSCDDNIRLAARDADSGPPSPGSPMPTCLAQELLHALTQPRRLSVSPAARAPAPALPSPPASIPPPPLSLPSRSERSAHPPRQAHDTAAHTDLASERESLRDFRAPRGAASRRAHHFLSFESRCPFCLALADSVGCLLSLRVLIVILLLVGSQGRIAPRHPQLPASPRLGRQHLIFCPR